MNAAGCAAKGLASFPAEHGDFQEREGLLHSLLFEFHCRVRDGAQGGWTCTHRSSPMAAAVEPGSVCSFGCRFLSVGLFSIRSGREVSGCQTPGGRCRLLILPGNGHKVKVNPDLLARAPLATEVHQPVHAD
ncbi:hypothetical protein NN561_013690 [Cricetulus griseus]